MSSLLHAGANKFRRAREWVSPTLKESAFLKRGVLTPEEFVIAGDELVYKCPTWQWASGDPKKSKSYLPSDKQFLITRNVPCQTRVSALENSVGMVDEENTVQMDDTGGEEWIVSEILSPEEQKRRIDQKIEDEFDILDEAGETVDSKYSITESMTKLALLEHTPDNLSRSKEFAKNVSNLSEQDVYADLEEFEDENILNDDAAVAMDNARFSQSSCSVEDNVLKVRTYDLSITYDKYYQTPRVYIIGYSSQDSSQPLTAEEMFEDVMSDYANRTVTIDPHPHVAGHYASIHPCQHGAVMKTIVKNLTRDSAEGGNGKAPSVEMYLFIFLKFVSSIIPTINYDFTMNVSASTEK